MAYGIMIIPMTLSDFQGHAPNVGFFDLFVQLCNRSQDFKLHRASRGFSATAEPLVYRHFMIDNFLDDYKQQIHYKLQNVEVLITARRRKK